MTPRPEYPRPILVRDDWLSLNGTWQFAADPADRGLREQWYVDHEWHDAITVPYPVESNLSGQGLIPAPAITWYQRHFDVPDWSAECILLHIGAADHATQVFINGELAGTHVGGYTPISLAITHLLQPGSNRITLRIADSDSWQQPRGKQAGTTRWPIDYDAVTGVWQTVWLEPVPRVHITGLHPAYQLADQCCELQVQLCAPFSGDVVATVRRDGQVITSARTTIDSRSEARLTLQFNDPLLWHPDHPHLYDLELEAPGGDRVTSYLGLRELSAHDGQVILNGEPIYLRGVLDQGYFPGGWYTAASDDDLKRDVELTRAMGFNLARKHQKAEDPRYLYWADRLGLMVWAEMPSGRIFSTDLVTSVTRDWLALVQRDRAHPSVTAWVPFNESWGVWHQAERPAQRAFVDALVSLTRSLDGTRPVIGNDGWEYSSGDYWTLHIYEGGQGDLSARLAALLQDPGSPVTSGERTRIGALPGADVTGLPVLLTECGGIGFLPADHEGDTFAYGDLPTTLEAFRERCEGVAELLHSTATVQGFVWTQLTDIQQEINGLLYFDRTPKLPLTDYHALFSRIAPAAGTTND